MRRIFVGGWYAVLILVILAIATSLLGIWHQSEQWGQSAALFWVLVAVGALTLGLTWMDKPKPEPLPPRAVRKRLRQEQERIMLDAAIKKAEREAGLP